MPRSRSCRRAFRTASRSFAASAASPRCRTGAGVPAVARDRLFELDVTTKGPGAGLGLPICRAIAEQHHGGTIRFDSEPSHTVFTVTLPRRRDPAEAQP